MSAHPLRATLVGCLGLVAAPLGLAAPGERPTVVVRVRASTAFAECTAAALEGLSRSHGLDVRVDAGDPAAASDADLVVGDDAELTRVLEGGRADVRTAIDLGYVPWVLVTPTTDTPRALADVKALPGEPLLVLGGALGREARGLIPPAAGPLVISGDAQALRRAPRAVVPLTLAGPGRRQRLDVRPLVAVAAVTAGARHAEQAHLVLDALAQPQARRAFTRCVGSEGEEGGLASPPVSEGATAQPSYARAVVDWWLPACSLAGNRYNDPEEVLDAPDALNLGGKDNYRGFMSLGQGGYVTVDMGQTFTDKPGADIRVYQTTSGEPVTLHAATTATGPFVLVASRRYCGVRTAGVFSNHCDFDLAEAGLGSARYLKVEDGEIYPCRAGGTVSEGADVDAVALLNP
jgi:hypothetical protein